MGYFWGLVKKEFLEIRYSYKQLIMYGGMYVIFAYLVYVTETEPYTVINYTIININYVLAIFISSFMSSNFLMESILSDKRNQTFERYFVSGNIKNIMLAKLSAMSIFGIVPFFMFFGYSLIKGINIIDTVFTAINTPFYFWIALCVVTTITFPFSNETSISFLCLPCLLAIFGIIIANDYIAANFHPMFTCITTIACAVTATIIAYKAYKNTKYFLKI